MTFLMVLQQQDVDQLMYSVETIPAKAEEGFESELQGPPAPPAPLSRRRRAAIRGVLLGVLIRLCRLWSGSEGASARCLHASHVLWRLGGLRAVDDAEAGQRDAAEAVDVVVGAAVHPLDQVLLVQQRVVGAERAGGVVEVLVVMAELRLPLGRQELVHVHHLTQRHHQDGACTGNTTGQ